MNEPTATADEVASTLEDGAADLRRRAAIGDRCMALAHDGPWTALERAPEVDAETAASDAISDILTALVGPAGYYVLQQSYERGREETIQGIQYDKEAHNKSRDLLERAFRSWEGDAEDYVRKDDTAALEEGYRLYVEAYDREIDDRPPLDEQDWRRIHGEAYLRGQ